MKWDIYERDRVRVRGWKGTVCTRVKAKRTSHCMTAFTSRRRTHVSFFHVRHTFLPNHVSQVDAFIEPRTMRTEYPGVKLVDQAVHPLLAGSFILDLSVSFSGLANQQAK